MLPLPTLLSIALEIAEKEALGFEEDVSYSFVTAAMLVATRSSANKLLQLVALLTIVMFGYTVIGMELMGGTNQPMLSIQMYTVINNHAYHESFSCSS